MANRETIGQVAVRIGPDTSQFRERARGLLEKEEKRLPELEATIRARFEDAARIAAEARAARNAAQAAMEDLKLKIDFDDAGSVKSAIALINKELQGVRAVEVGVSLNEDDLVAAKNVLQDHLRAVGIELRVDEQSAASLRRALSRINAELEKVEGRRLHISLDKESLENAKRELTDKLADVERIRVRVDIRSAESIRQAIKQIERELDAEPGVIKYKNDRESLEAALADLRKRLDQVTKVELVVSDLELKRGIKAAEEFLRVNELKIRTKVDEEAVRREVEKIALKFVELRQLKLKLDAEVDELAKAKIRQQIAEIQDDIWRSHPQRMRLQPEMPERDRSALSAALAFLTRPRKIPIELDFRRSIAQAGTFIATLSTFKAFRDGLDDARRILAGMFTNLPNFAAANVGVLAMAGSVVALSSNIVGLTQSVAQLIPLLAAIPGIAIGMATTVAALKDVPSVLPDIVAGFKGLQSVISEAFWSVARGPISDLMNRTLPLLDAGLAATSTRIGGFFAALSRDLSSTFLPELPGMFDNLGESIRIFTAYTPSLANILTMFGQLGSSLLPPLASLMGRITEEFEAWFATQIAGERMNQTINAAISALSGLFEIVKGLGSVFGALFDAASAAGATSFETFGLALQRFAGTLRELQPELTAFFRAGHEMFENLFTFAGTGFQDMFKGLTAILSNVLPIVGTTLGKLVDAIGGYLSDPRVVGGYTKFIEGIAAGVNAILPMFDSLASLFGALGPTLGLLAQQIGETFAALSPAAGKAIEALMPLITSLSTGLQRVLVALSPAIQQVADALTLAFSHPAVHQAIENIADALIALIPALTPIFALAPQFIDLLANGLLAITEPLAGMFEQLVPLFHSIAAVMPQIYAAVEPLIPTLVDLLVTALVPLLPMLVELAQAVLPLLPVAVNLAVMAFKLLAPILELLLGTILPPFTEVWRGLVKVVEIVVDLFSKGFLAALDGISEGLGKLQEGIHGFSNWWREIWGKVFDFFEEIWTKIIDWVLDFLGIRSPSRVFIEIAESIIAGLLSGLADNWGRAQEWFRSAMQWVRDTVRNALDTVVSFFAGLWGQVTSAVGDLAGRVRSFFRAAWDEIYGSLRSAWTSVSSWLSGLRGRIVDSIGNVKSTLTPIGRDLINGFLSGIKAMSSTVVATIKGYVLDKVPDSIKRFFGIRSPSRMFHDFGVNLMQGLALGIKDSSDEVVRALRGVVGDVAGLEFRPPGFARGVSPGLYAGGGSGAGNTLIYYAAPGSSLGAEEDLFSAIGRARAFGW